MKDLNSKTWDVAIVGGGIAGGVAAYHLARMGLETVLLEKEKSPSHKVCGEFLSGEGVRLLEEIGIDFRALDASVITGFRLNGPQRTAESKLPVAAFGLSRLVLDQAIIARAEEAGAQVVRGITVREKLEGLDDTSAVIGLDTSQGQVNARRLILATGKHEFRSIQNREGRDNDLVGFKMHLRLKPSVARRVRDHCELFIFEHGYGGLAPIENGLFNFCFLIEKKALRAIGTSWEALSYYIARNNWEASLCLDGAEPQFKNFVTVAKVPYGFIRRAKAEPGVFCVGDQMAVIPSLTGDGMSIAAMTGSAVAYAIGESAQSQLRSGGRLRAANASSVYQREMRRRLKPQVESAYYLHRLFRSPALCDWATYVVSAFPWIVDMLFNRTRVKMDSPQPLLARAVKRLHA